MQVLETAASDMSLLFPLMASLAIALIFAFLLSIVWEGVCDLLNVNKPYTRVFASVVGVSMLLYTLNRFGVI